jgi:hypothetical protein
MKDQAIGTYRLYIALFTVALFIALLWPTLAPAAFQAASDPTTSRSTQAYLPALARDDCPGNNIVNGGFEQGRMGWSEYTTGQGWKAHNLIGSYMEGFQPHGGRFGARLGGYEGVWDAITQPVTLPTGGQLSFWWKMGTYENLPHTDHLFVQLLEPGGDSVAVLARHDDQDLENVWLQDTVDVSAYAGQTLVLRVSASNDNYYFTWFDLDEICLLSVPVVRIED